MKVFLPAVLSLIVWQSCATHQVVMIESPVASQKGSESFVVENDSFRITYNFSGKNAPLKLTITNKLTTPLVIDWRRSALIMNGQSIPFASIPGVFQGTSSGSSVNWGAGISTSSQQIRAVAHQSSERELIPPGTFMIKRLEGLTNQPMASGSGSRYESAKMDMGSGMKQRVSVVRFDASNSPLTFQAYLTLVVEGSQSQEIICRHSFFVAEIIRTTASATYLEKDTSAGKFFVKEMEDINKRYSTGYILAGGKPILQNPAFPKPFTGVYGPSNGKK